LEFGISITPMATELPLARKLAERADALGLDLIGIQDHPYQRRFLDTWVLIADLLARTERIRIFPDVANLPLRGPSIIAKQAASLDLLSGGRFELGLGAGAFWDAIAAMGGPKRTPGESVEALEETVQAIRLCWSGERTVNFSGRYYSLKGLHPGPAPVHDIAIWIGAYGPRMLNLTGRIADGWVPSLPYLRPENVLEAQNRIDDGARQTGRDPSTVRRIYNLDDETGDAVPLPVIRMTHGLACVPSPSTATFSGDVWHCLERRLDCISLRFKAQRRSKCARDAVHQVQGASVVQSDQTRRVPPRAVISKCQRERLKFVKRYQMPTGFRRRCTLCLLIRPSADQRTRRTKRALRTVGKIDFIPEIFKHVACRIGVIENDRVVRSIRRGKDRSLQKLCAGRESRGNEADLRFCPSNPECSPHAWR
jgi:hypothetical protein